MTSLVACLGNEAGTAKHLEGIINKQEWGNIIVVCEKESKGLIKTNKKIEYIMIDSNKFLQDIVKELKEKLESKIKEVEVAINLVSGSGKLHMATLSALLKIGLGIRLVALTINGVKEI